MINNLRQYRTILSMQDAQDLLRKSSDSFVRRYKESEQLLRNCGRVPPLSRIFNVKMSCFATQTEKMQADACLRRKP